MDLSTGRYHSFVVRVLCRDGLIIQGEITHVGTRRSVKFTDCHRVVEFVTDAVRPSVECESHERSAEEIG